MTRAFILMVVAWLALAAPAWAQADAADDAATADDSGEDASAEAEGSAEDGSAEPDADPDDGATGEADDVAVDADPEAMAEPAEEAQYPPGGAPTADEEVVYVAPDPTAAEAEAAAIAAARQRTKVWPRAGYFAFLFAYSPSVAVGSSADFASNFGYRGFALGVRYFATDSISVGFESGWAIRDDKRRDTVSASADGRRVTLTTGNLRYSEIVPVTVTGHYYLHVGNVVPFAGLALGAYYSKREVDAGVLYVADDAWHFGFAPELGLLVPTGGINLFVSTRFNYAFEGGDLPEETFFDFRIGMFGF